MTAAMHAIILAAGKSKRLGAITENTPKCLLSLGSTTILEHQIENLAANGIRTVSLVTGFCEDKIRETLGNAVHYISNSVYDTTNSIYSLWLALQEIRGSVIILNADVVFHPGILTNLIASPYPDALAISFQGGMGDEEMKVTVRNEKIHDISKDMDPSGADGENVGIIKFSPQGRDALFETVDELVGAGVVNAWAPRAFQKMCASFDLYSVSTAGLPWIEIDFPEDLEEARREIYPRICDG